MKALAYIGGFLALLASLWIIWDNGGNYRENKIKLQIANQNNEAFDKAYKEIVRLQIELQETENEILAEPTSEIRPSDPVIRRYYERLRLQREQRDKGSSR